MERSRLFNSTAGGFMMALKNSKYLLSKDDFDFFESFKSKDSIIAAAYYAGLHDGKHYRLNSRKKKGENNTFISSDSSQVSSSKDSRAE